MHIFLNDVLRRIFRIDPWCKLSKPQDEVHRDPAQGLPHWSTEAVPGPVKLLSRDLWYPGYKIYCVYRGLASALNMSRLWQHWTDHTKRWSKTSTHWECTKKQRDKLKDMQMNLPLVSQWWSSSFTMFSNLMYQVNVKICSQQGTHFLEFADEASWDFTRLNTGLCVCECANQAFCIKRTYHKTRVQWGYGNEKYITSWLHIALWGNREDCQNKTSTAPLFLQPDRDVSWCFHSELKEWNLKNLQHVV